jgi:hypothetical protein
MRLRYSTKMSPRYLNTSAYQRYNVTGVLHLVQKAFLIIYTCISIPEYTYYTLWRGYALVLRYLGDILVLYLSRICNCCD